MSERPLFSVVMSVYNSELFLASAIESILRQTIRDLEFIIINDGSSDNSLEIIRSYLDIDQRIVLVNRENRGLSVSLNEGIALARGEYIARMDADDVSLPTRLERQLQWMRDSRSELCGCWIKVVETCRPRVIRYATDDRVIKTQLMFNSAFAHPSVIAQSDVFKLDQYDASIGCAQDYDLWTRLALKGIVMSNCPEPLLEYRMHGAQATKLNWDLQQDARNRIALSYWKSLGIDLDIADTIKLHSLSDFDFLVSLLNRQSLDENAVKDGILKICLRSCSFGLELWRRSVKAGIVRSFSTRSLALMMFSAIGKDEFPMKLKQLLDRFC